MMRLRSALTVLALVSLMPGARVLAQEQQLDTVEQQLESSKQAEARIAAEIAAAIKEQDGVADKLVAISKAILIFSKSDILLESRLFFPAEP